MAALLCAFGLKRWYAGGTQADPRVFEPDVPVLQPEPLCPWREPSKDLEALFPAATRYYSETRVLSGLRTELSARLGRTPTSDENALVVHRVYNVDTPLGAVVTRRVKGDYGAIELVLAVGLDGTVRGLRLQRHREPDDIAKALQAPDWLASFIGKGADSEWKLGHTVPAVAAEVRFSAEAIVEGTRSVLILLAAAEREPGAALTHAQHSDAEAGVP